MKSNVINKPHYSLGWLFSLLILSGIGTADTLSMNSGLGQSLFSTPMLAAQTLVKAISDQDKEAMNKVLGADYERLLPVGEIDPVDRDNFLAAWEISHTLIPEGDRQSVLAVGENNWTLPIPMVKGDSGWYFDIDAGAERMRIRRIGRNELAAMQAVLAYYDAQMEYAEQDHDSDGRLEYAKQFISSPGKHDGLYWEVSAGEKMSPLGPLFVQTDRQDAYHGYHYRILESQGEHAQGGDYSYLVNSRMMAGFALVAWPAEYGDSGVMSFIVSHQGIVYEQDLGVDSATLTTAMGAFDPAPGWRPVQEVHNPQVSVNKE